MTTFPLGKLPAEILSKWLTRFDTVDPRVILGPGIGLDCAVLDYGDQYLVVKSDPITFTSKEIGWYAVHVNANDIVTTGANPLWFLATLLLPEGRSDQLLIDSIFTKIKEACEELAVTLIGGHTEITQGLDRPIIVGTMIGEVSPERLITPEGARPGDVILLTKGVPLEAASILARECAQDLSHLDKRLLSRARDYLTDPGISVVEEALTAASVGGVTAMHDPTEGGLSAALWEMSDAAKIGLEINPEAVPILPEAALICQSLHIAPFEAIASGALLLAVRSESVDAILSALRKIEIPVHVIGRVTDKIGVYMRKENKVTDLPRPSRDALAVFFEKHPIGNSPSENHEG